MTTIRLMLAAAVVAGSAQALSAQSLPAAWTALTPASKAAPTLASTAVPTPASQSAPSADGAVVPPGMETPAQRKMAMAQRKITRDPKHFHGYNELALALTQRARETADPRFYQQADAAVTTSLALSPEIYRAEVFIAALP